MGKKNGKWVVGAIIAVVAALSFISVLLKNDIMRRSAAKEAAEAVSN